VARVAFVYVPTGHVHFGENLRVVDEDFGLLPPLSLAYAAAIARRAGHTIDLIDANVLRLSRAETLARLRRFRPDAVCCSVSTYMFRHTTDWMAFFKRELGVATIAGGINVRLFPRETLAHAGIDYGVLHFGLRGLPALLAALAAGRSPAGLPEVVARDRAGEVVAGPVDLAGNPFDELPLPARDCLPNEKYCSIISQRRNFTIAVASTGCRHTCSFCAIPGLPRHQNTVENVVQEVRESVTRHAVREIDFFDADFFADKEWAHALCVELAARRLDLEWSCRARLEHLDRATLALAYRAGCRKIYVGIETPNEAALRAMRKQLRLARISDTLGTMREVGIRPLGFFMLGVPGETYASAWRTIRHALSLPLDYAQFCRMIAKPGSHYARGLMQQTGHDYWREYVLGRRLPRRPKNIWSHIDDRAVERLCALAYLAFYFRPQYFVRALLKMRSFDELARSARTAGRMLVGFLRDRDA
jgi:anaerobic magnesium-protoporphyrin IX monomethyl ester cyclase